MKTGEIIEFKEKPKGDALEAMRVDTTRFGLTREEGEARPFLASMGIYVFNYERLVELLKKMNRWVDFGREIIPRRSKISMCRRIFSTITGKTSERSARFTRLISISPRLCRNSIFSTPMRRSTRAAAICRRQNFTLATSTTRWSAKAVS